MLSSSSLAFSLFGVGASSVHASEVCIIFLHFSYCLPIFPCPITSTLSYYLHIASVAEWLRAWDTLTMFEATVSGRS